MYSLRLNDKVIASSEQTTKLILELTNWTPYL